MEEWSKSIFETLELLGNVVDDFFLEVNEIFVDLTEELHNTVSGEIEKSWWDIFEPIAEIYLDIEEVSDEPDDTLIYPMILNPERPKACQDCDHYHGQIYGGNVLICGIHPYGWDTEQCPDWESSLGRV